MTYCRALLPIAAAVAFAFASIGPAAAAPAGKVSAEVAASAGRSRAGDCQ